MLQLLDILLTLVHIVIIGFNLLGWIWKRTRKLHLFCVAITAGCWLILGIWYGIGYCPVTDYQWRIKEQLGEQNLPGSFIKYMADKITGRDINSDLIDAATGLGFLLAVIMAVYFNFISPRLEKRRNQKA
ncbi:DUF2784 domain-containing protein [Mucilaginibacter conchicola]|uniref:DUF2784 domain-containing protein n=1 Tax=Mucilaginibacter conchicola TaxID=2303333 RepID=A0A372NN94_9SPHI|nr:DUF2784 domain-containing protein [Mucilaginibacter conchicola]RFZ90401.1 DUF2784 domain-containing protein [Mucilaginibacter conchicola]